MIYIPESTNLLLRVEGVSMIIELIDCNLDAYYSTVQIARFIQYMTREHNKCPSTDKEVYDIMVAIRQTCDPLVMSESEANNVIASLMAAMIMHTSNLEMMVVNRASKLIDNTLIVDHHGIKDAAKSISNLSRIIAWFARYVDIHIHKAPVN